MSLVVAESEACTQFQFPVPATLKLLARDKSALSESEFSLGWSDLTDWWLRNGEQVLAFGS
jgi:hypothetical protein